MKYDNEVCSLEQAKELKELGVKQDSFYSWQEQGYETHEGVTMSFGIYAEYGIDDTAPKYSAYSCGELGAMDDYEMISPRARWIAEKIILGIKQGRVDVTELNKRLDDYHNKGGYGGNSPHH
jgi:hypothetical protein